MANLYLNFAQPFIHTHTLHMSPAPRERMCRETLRPIPHSICQMH